MPPVAQLRGGRRGSIGGYPHQWFDISSTYMPPTVKELFRWCHYLYSSHSEIAPIINKKCSYVITGLIYETPKEKPKDLWKEVLEKTLKIRELEYKLLLDFSVYGNAFCSILYPFERYLVCPACENKQVAIRGKWTYSDFQFSAKCDKCGRKGNMKAEDKVIRNRSRIKVVRWNPQYIDIRYNPLTDASEYIYRIPKWMRQRVENKQANAVFVEGTPLEFLKAIKERKNLLLDTSNVYHFKNPSVSSEDDAFGMPPMLPIFKDAWLFQTYKRAQEAIALEHALPLTLLIPQPSQSGVSPHMNTDLGEWSRKMMDIVHRWRRDQNSIYTVPFPVSVENVRGDANNLNVFNEMNQVRQQIAGGLDVPQEFVYGNLSWSGSSISLRVLENIFLSTIDQLNAFLQDFLIPKLQMFLSLPPVKIRHKDFKMADDAQQRQIALGLRQTNTVSDLTVLEELGFDPELERRRRQDEASDRDNAVTKTMSVQAEAQGKAMLIQTEYQLRAQQLQQQAQQQAAAAAGPQIPPPREMKKTAAAPGMPQPPAPAQPPMPQAPAQQMATLPVPPDTQSPHLIEVMADKFIKDPGDADAKKMELANIRKTNPLLATAISEKLSMIREQGRDPFLRPLPEHQAPRRDNSPI
jgi:hypothetical protein